MRRAILAFAFIAGGMFAGSLLAVAAPPTSPKPPPAASAAPPADPSYGAPTVTSLAGMMEKDLKWGMSHVDVTYAYNTLNGRFDQEYGPQIARLQPGSVMQQLEADRESRKGAFERSYTRFLDTPTGYDVTPLHAEYTYKNDEAIQKVFKDGKTRYFFYIKDQLWKMYDEVPLKPTGSLGNSFQEAVTKLNTVLGVPARIRAADPAQGLDRPTADWQDVAHHLRAVDRSSEHLVGVVLEDKKTLTNLATLRANKPTDPFAIDPSIAAITKGGVSDPNAAKGNVKDGGGKGKNPKKK